MGILKIIQVKIVSDYFSNNGHWRTFICAFFYCVSREDKQLFVLVFMFIMDTDFDGEYDTSGVDTDGDLEPDVLFAYIEE